jgi:hypothetical protein
MTLDFILLIALGPVIGLFAYYLHHDRKRTEHDTAEQDAAGLWIDSAIR